MTLTASAAWLNSTLREAFPSADAVEIGPVSMSPVDNLLGTVAFPLFVFVAVLAVAGSVSREKESATLAWVASKPVSRSSIWLAKWITSSTMLAVTVAILPLTVTVAIVAPLYGLPDAGIALALGLGMVATVVFYAAVVLVLGTMLSSQAAVAGAAFGVAFLPSLVGIIPLPLSPLMPASILPWAIGMAQGVDVGIATPFAWLAVTLLLIGYGMHRMEQMEL